MSNWADHLIIQYEDGRKELTKAKQILDDKIEKLMMGENQANMDSVTLDRIKKNESDQSQINSMILSMTEAIEWMRTGKDPGTMKGIEKRSIYQSNSIDNMDLFPSLDVKPKERELTEEEKQYVYEVLRELSPRERQCFIFQKAYMWTFSQIAEEVGVGKSTVQKYIERAEEKIKHFKK
ncbi:hypothetical protein Pryu01_02771 [Paraliobacillus ryukyuensis]|uniref:RNA polymerase sigma-70 factor (ECF subfamily) n=1 Tax=Paraliobacillus ryukyuensis TaxID=200904 RepID=A0A366DUQ0_9BACI|nr:sigma-70 family RNA polymerase sigma factor [Paraliobacillus ryukyuensis]RBO93219.1 RNA polymerase sigma-70 factor (ECF subfamily) [Paraliobacillus ryukyuensis]